METARKLSPPSSETDPWMSVVQAAKALSLSRQTIYQHCLQKKLQSKTVAGRVVVSRASVERALAGRETAAVTDEG